MSWEGYQQNLCINGHHYDTDPYGDESIFCPHCSAARAWWNIVDTTNGSFYIDPNGKEGVERIDGYVELEKMTEPVICKCHCGNQHVLSPATFRLPPDGIGHKVLA